MGTRAVVVQPLYHNTKPKMLKNPKGAALLGSSLMLQLRPLLAGQYPRWQFLSVGFGMIKQEHGHVLCFLK